MPVRDEASGGDERLRRSYLKYRSVLHDRTTGLPSYPLLIDRLRTLLDARRAIGVIHVALAKLETVESLYGWQVFDQVVRQAAESLKGVVTDDLPGGSELCIDRVAGGSFVLFVPAADDGGDPDGEAMERMCGRVASRLEQAFRAEEFAGLNPRIRVETGHALLSVNPFYRFERRLYTAIDEARGRESRLRSRQERTRGEELRRIIEDAEVEMFYQPVLELSTRRILGYEALARGPRDSQFERPREMFDLSLSLGQAVDLDRLCRRSVMADSASIEGRGELFLNVLSGCLDDPDWEKTLGNGRDANPWRIVLDVSERGADQDEERFLGSLERLKAMGFCLALDDIGTGYASLHTLERVRPDYLKVDASVVRDVHQSLIKQEILASLVQIAERIEAEVIAEGIETREEASYLAAAGARYGQGYFFAGPKPIHRLARREDDR